MAHFSNPGRSLNLPSRRLHRAFACYEKRLRWIGETRECIVLEINLWVGWDAHAERTHERGAADPERNDDATCGHTPVGRHDGRRSQERSELSGVIASPQVSRAGTD
jgi:hypothetical protein